MRMRCGVREGNEEEETLGDGWRSKGIKSARSQWEEDGECEEGRQGRRWGVNLTRRNVNYQPKIIFPVLTVFCIMILLV